MASSQRALLALTGAVVLGLAGVVVSCTAVAPYTACGLLSPGVFLAWFVSRETGAVHDSNETEDYVIFFVTLWTAAVLLYAPDSAFATVRGLWAALIALGLAFVCNVLSRSRHRKSLLRAGDVRNRWPRRPSSVEGVSDAHTVACVDQLKEALNSIDLSLVPGWVNSLVRLPKVLACEARIYEIFADDTLQREELSDLVMAAPTSLLFYKVKDHVMLARFFRGFESLWSRRGVRSLSLPARTRHAFENRTNLIRLLCHTRLPDLSLRARAILIDGLQRVRLTDPVVERAVENILLKTFSTDLLLLKNLCDAKGTHRSLHRLVFADVLTPDIRSEILRHFSCQAGLAGHRLRTQGRGTVVLRKILSDVDDTFICSGGHFPAGMDARLPSKAIYPGAPAFFRHIDRTFGTGGLVGMLPEGTESLTGGQQLGNLAFLSARPHVYKGYSEDKTLARFEGLRTEGRLHCVPTMLCGSLDSGLKFVWKDELEPMATKKFVNFSEYAQLYPEYSFVFVGDNGQADLRAATMMLETHPELMEAIFIHLVQPVECSYGLSSFEALPPERRCKIVFFRNYLEAATMAFERGLLPASGLAAVLQRTHEDFEALRFTDLTARERMRLEVNDCARCAEAMLARAGCSASTAWRPLQAVQDIPESTEVLTLYGLGRVMAFRQEDGVYTVKLAGWRATAHVHMFGVHLATSQRHFLSSLRGRLFPSKRAPTIPPRKSSASADSDGGTPCGSPLSGPRPWSPASPASLRPRSPEAPLLSLDELGLEELELPASAQL